MEIARLKNVLRRKMVLSKNIYLIGHNDIDLDAFGSIVGINSIVKKYHKTANIIIDDNDLEPGVKKALFKIKDSLNIVNTKDIKNFDDSLLIILDTNKKALLACSELLDKFSSIIIIDHHDIGKDSIKDGIKFIYNDVSSTCEIITELIKILNIKIDDYMATILLSGIVLDTNNFILKATKETFYVAYYLTKKGASTVEVQYLLKQDLKKFVNREKMLTNVRIIDQKIAIAKGVKEEFYRREDLAKIAETLLLFNNIETSYVIGNLMDSKIGISARTLGKTNVGKNLSEFGGGGSATEAAAKISNSSIAEVEDKLIEILNK